MRNFKFNLDTSQLICNPNIKLSKTLNAFTLAEAIIVMTILGIIASLVITNLRPDNYRDGALETLTKKSIEQIDEATKHILHYNSFNGTMNELYLPGENEKFSFSQDFSKTFQLYKKYLTTTRKEYNQSLEKLNEIISSSSNANTQAPPFYLKDGGLVYLGTGEAYQVSPDSSGTITLNGCEMTKSLVGIMTIDVNGDKEPNLPYKDQFHIPIGLKGIEYEQLCTQQPSDSLAMEDTTPTPAPTTPTTPETPVIPEEEPSTPSEPEVSEPSTPSEPEMPEAGNTPSYSDIQITSQADPNLSSNYHILSYDECDDSEDCIEATTSAMESHCQSLGNYFLGHHDGYYFQNGWDGTSQAYCIKPCLPADTLITLSNYTQKPIQDITFDDDLLVWDFDNAKFATSKPIWIKKPHVVDKYNLLTFSNGEQLKTVEQHRIYNIEQNKFTYPMTDDTPIGTTTFTSNGEKIKLIKKEIIEKPVEYYNLITAYHFNCFAQNILTSNRFNNLYPIKDMKFIKDNRKLTPYDEYKNFVSKEWYDKMRLAEQVCDEEMKYYLSNLTRLNKVV